MNLSETQLDRKKSELLLAAVIIARSTSFMFSKIMLKTMGQFTLLGIRSLLAFAVLLLFFGKQLKNVTKKELTGGLLLGIAYFTVMFFELNGLKYTESSTMSLLENSAVVFVPVFMSVFTRSLPEKKAVIKVLLALAGVILLRFKGGTLSFGRGEFFGIAAAMLYALAIILTKRLSSKADPLLCGVFQAGTMGVLGIIFALFFETPALPRGGAQWGAIIYLAVICSSFGFTFQPLAQRGTTAERTGTFCALSPVSASILGAVFLKEMMTVPNIIGAALVLCSILI